MSLRTGVSEYGSVGVIGPPTLFRMLDGEAILRGDFEAANF